MNCLGYVVSWKMVWRAYWAVDRGRLCRLSMGMLISPGQPTGASVCLMGRVQAARQWLTKQALNLILGMISSAKGLRTSWTCQSCRKGDCTLQLPRINCRQPFVIWQYLGPDRLHPWTILATLHRHSCPISRVAL